VDWAERERERERLRRSLLSSVQITFTVVINTAGGLIASALTSKMAATLDAHLVESLQSLPGNSALASVSGVLVAQLEAPTAEPSFAPTALEEPDANPILVPSVAAILLIGLFAYHAHNADWKTSIIVSFARMGTSKNKDKVDKDKENKNWKRRGGILSKRLNHESEVQCLTLAQLRERKAKKMALLSSSSNQVVPCPPEEETEGRLAVSFDDHDCVLGYSDGPPKTEAEEEETKTERENTRDSTLLDDSWGALFAPTTNEDNESLVGKNLSSRFLQDDPALLPLKPKPLSGDVVGEGQFKLRPGSRHLSARPIYDEDSERTRPPLHLMRIQSPLRSATANTPAARRIEAGNSAGIAGMLSRPATVSPNTNPEPSAAARPNTTDIDSPAQSTPKTKPEK
jgi:hypothetical protein